MTGDRDLSWEGSYNARDLGGLPTADGRRIRRGAVVRSEAPDGLTAGGWTALREHGIRTIVDLREAGERAFLKAAADLDVVHAPIDDPEDTAFWGRFPVGADATPLFYRDSLERKPERAAKAVAGIARARPGGVLVHCAGGRDRTGLVTMVLLRLLGVPDEEIIADFVHSYRRMVPLWAAFGEDDNGLAVRGFLAELGTTPEAAMQVALDGLDAEAVLRAGGLTDTDYEALRSRLLD